jgi:hypothetical protein
LEAIDKAGLDETDDERGRNRIKNVRAVAGSRSLSSCAETTSETELLKRLSDMQTAFDRCRSELEQHRREATF